MPSLLKLLEFEEHQKGRDLTQEEVVNIRNNAVAMTISEERLKKFEELQGYQDINPENCWKEWSAYKKIATK